MKHPLRRLAIGLEAGSLALLVSSAKVDQGVGVTAGAAGFGISLLLLGIARLFSRERSQK